MPCYIPLPVTQQSGMYLGQRLLVPLGGPTVPSDWALVATTDLNGDGYPDYLLYNAATRQTAIWYLNKTFTPAPRLTQLFRPAGAWPRRE